MSFITYLKEQKNETIPLGLSLFLFAICLLIPFDQLFGPQGLIVEFCAFLIPYLLVGHSVLTRAARNILKGKIFDENFLMALATIGAFSLVFFPESNPHMAEGAAVMIFYQLGELFQDFAVNRSRKSIQSLMDIAPVFARIQTSNGYELVDPDEVEIGQTVVVFAGERIPLDGIVTSGVSNVDTSALTGESMLQAKAKGDELISGCINQTGVLSYRVTKCFEDSTVSRILELVECSIEKKSKAENFISKFARYYTPVVVCIAVLLAFVMPLILMASFADWIQRALVFLVVSCPCALVISVPLSFFGGIGAASKSGILIKGSNYLETLTKVETIVFDKTGTLTQGKFSLKQIVPQEGVAPEYLLALAAYGESHSTHPLSQCIISAAQNMAGLEYANLKLCSKFQEVAGHGLIGHRQSCCEQTFISVEAPTPDTPAQDELCCINFKHCPHLLVGARRLLELHHIQNIPEVSEKRASVIYVAFEGACLGYLLVEDLPKPQVKQSLSTLRNLGIKHLALLSGDTKANAEALAHELGIDEVHAQLLPQDKVAQFEALMQANPKHKLAFVGDGVNDAPVLARADVGIAMGGLGSDAAIEAADIVLMEDDPAQIAQALQIARKTMRITHENIVFALGIKFLVLGLAALGFANLWLAVFADVGVSALAILNAMRCLVKTKNDTLQDRQS